ncbi:hypothetical protein HS088_TW02G00389 [Tripterygium wilfordii]|uniref:Uncharacterized protein n=1 Tax=Tripterygium wilfordii TaxID=458696 RepID=A0A7J7DZ63_TRIWF|nr:hypothetical protein HS088_TW02G00389 [Tripterygium wilfordii]
MFDIQHGGNYNTTCRCIIVKKTKYMAPKNTKLQCIPTQEKTSTSIRTKKTSNIKKLKHGCTKLPGKLALEQNHLLCWSRNLNSDFNLHIYISWLKNSGMEHHSFH